METSICPHCLGQYIAGAAMCYRCRRYISWKSWLRMNWIGAVIMAAIIVGFSFLLTQVALADEWEVSCVSGCENTLPSMEISVVANKDSGKKFIVVTRGSFASVAQIIEHDILTMECGDESVITQLFTGQSLSSAVSAVEYDERREIRARGINDALDAMILLGGAELPLSGERKTWGEMADIVRERLSVSK